MDEQFGYNVEFVHDDVPDDLKCIICHLVMRHPVQIMACGHRLCKSCLHRIETYAVHLNTPLLCPFDREAIDMKEVFNDTAVSRTINNLEAKCSNASKGCSWTGRLGSFQDHDQTCKFKQNQLALHEDNSIMIKSVEELSIRLMKLEDMFMVKEKELSCLSHNVEQLNERCKKQAKELNDVKKENADLKVAITTNANAHQTEHLDTNQKLEMVEVKCENNAGDIAVLKKGNPNYTERLKMIDDDVNSLSNQLKRKVNEETHRNRIESLKQKCINIEKQVEDLENLKKQLEELHTDHHENKGTYGNMEKQVEDLQNDLRTISAKSTEVGEQCRIIEEHVINLENLQFFPSGSNECLIQWKMTNFQSQLETGGDVWSPVFHTSIDGYAFKFRVRWTDRKNFMGLHMKIHRSKYCVFKHIKPYKIPFRLEIVDEKGSLKFWKVIDEIFFKRCKASFEIPDGSDCAKQCFGYPDFIDMNDINQYVVNDTITIQCRFYLQ